MISCDKRKGFFVDVVFVNDKRLKKIFNGVGKLCLSFGCFHYAKDSGDFDRNSNAYGKDRFGFF